MNDENVLNHDRRRDSIEGGGAGRRKSLTTTQSSSQRRLSAGLSDPSSGTAAATTGGTDGRRSSSSGGRSSIGGKNASSIAAAAAIVAASEAANSPPAKSECVPAAEQAASTPAKSVGAGTSNTTTPKQLPTHTPSRHRVGPAAATTTTPKQLPTHTPSRHRVRLPSAGQYYFKNMNSTKKHGDTSFMSNGHSVGWGDTVGHDEINAVLGGAGGNGGGDTGTFSQASMAMGDTSFFSIGASTSSSEASNDVLNKSTLSDTTELTASNFVLVATSKQALLQGSVALNKKLEKKKTDEQEGEVHELKQSADAESQPPHSAEKEVEAIQSRNTVRSPQQNEENQNDSQAGHQRKDKIGQLENHDGERERVVQLQGASPSIRSRINSSPASLREFSEGLRRSRLQRQQQRENDAKRRQSVEGDNSIHSMNAELDMLTTETVFSRKRLPPTFAQPSKVATMPTTSTNSSNQKAESDTTSFVNMEEVDDLLGIENRSSPARRSSITDSQSDIQRLLGTSENEEKQQTPTASNNRAEDKNENRRMSVPFSIAFHGEFGGDSSPEGLLSEGPNSAKSTTSRRSRRSSSGVGPAANLHTSFGSKKKADSASNSEEVDSGKTNLLNTSESSACASVKSTSKNDTVSSPPFDGDETASLGDLNKILGMSTANNSSNNSPGTSFNQSMNDESMISGVDTASITDINALLGIGAGINSDADDKETISDQVRASIGSKDNTASISDINALLGTGGGATSDVDTSYEAKDENNGKNTAASDTGSIRDSVGSKGDTASISEVDALLGIVETTERNETAETHFKLDAQESTSNDVRLSVGSEDETASISDVNAILGLANTSNSSSFERSIGADDRESMPTLANDLPLRNEENLTASPSSTPPKIDMTRMSPGGKKLLSQTKGSSPITSRLSFQDRAEIRGALDLGEERMVLSPNSHVAPTPTKLKPQPRRVLNPNNPESPARNTRRSSRRHSVTTLDEELPNSPARSTGSTSRKNSLEAMESSAVDSPARNTRGSSQKRSIDTLERAEVDSPARNTRGSRRKQSLDTLESEAVLSHAAGSKRRKSSISVLNHTVLSTGPDERKVGINGTSTPSNRSVAFGSPEVATYNVGSPSASFTPMPKSEAKALYPLPDKSTEENDGASTFKSNIQMLDNNDETVQIESDLNALVDKISDGNMSGSPELSPIEKNGGDTGVFNFPAGTRKGVSKDASPSEFSPSSQSPSLSRTGMQESHEDKTVELEVAMQSLIENNMKDPIEGQLTSHASKETSPTESVQLADSDSIASVHSRSGKFTAQFEVPLEAQKLDFSIDATDGAMSLDMDSTRGTINEEGQTVDLEGNMTTLLATAGLVRSNREDSKVLEANEADPRGGNDTSLFDSGDDLSMVESPWHQNGKENSRRKSIASKSFSLDCSQKSVSFSNTTEFIESIAGTSSNEDQDMDTGSIDESNSVTEQECETLVSCILELIRNSNKPNEGTQDAMEVFSSTDQGMDVVVFEKWGQLLQAACTEIESTNEERKAKETLLDEITNTTDYHVRNLLRKLESTGTDRTLVETSIRNLVADSHRKVVKEWDLWISQVVESYQTQLLDVASNFAGESSSIEDALASCNEYHQMILRTGDENARQARRKSLLRRTAGSTSLENEIASIENELSEMEKELHELRNNTVSLKEEKKVLNQTLHAASKHNALHSMASDCQKNYLSLRGLHSWNIGSLLGTGMVFTTLGSCPQTCSKMYVEGMNTKAIELRLEKVQSIGPSSQSKGLYRYKGATAMFLNACVERMERVTSRALLDSPSQVAEQMQTYAWRMGRLDLTAKELHMLHRRYGAKLVRKNNDIFSLAIGFASSTGKVAVEFHVDPRYPSLPVDVRLDLIEGHADLDVLLKSLTKNAKPGFGSLSKACDIMHSVLSD
eukprot:CAMPEP_0113522466 /NCGR_PEP_ID=MMETSP0014_2-20120614/45204_1 /TAXON_ID=2857 /ORGANISM="Nitzschia sp." /LENGTH=1907 /DNA_ID=CAMNT_0000420525 /DNA_START=175 /DNA_END=5899 /DNA_ORIENTATION=+ /assembly_acc=CAM_ASM_000159